MNEGAPMIYHGNGSYGAFGPLYMLPHVERYPRQYSMDMLQFPSGRGRGSPSSGRGTPRRRSQPRRYRQTNPKGDKTAFGYDSDDSSISSNASGSNKSGDTVESTSHHSNRSMNSSANGYSNGYGNGYSNGYNNTREWRGRTRREPQRQRRIMPNATYPHQVKYTPDDLLNGSEWDKLSQEIWDKFIKSQQTEETFKKKINLWRNLFVTIKTIFPRYGLYVVGSTMSGFGLDSSDMDLCLYVRPLDNLEPRTQALLHLNYILGYIKSFDPSAELIQAKVPILKFREAGSGLQVDLNCNNLVGIRNTSLLYHYCNLDWRVRPLVAVAKLWARANNINDARHRTLSSYSLTLMVIHYLQCGVSPAVLPYVCVRTGATRARPRNRATLAELFLNMLDYYARFPYDKMAISVRAGRAIPIAECRAVRSHKNDPHQWKLLCVEEPFDLTNTARSVYDPETFERIVATFRTSHARLARGMRLADAWPQPHQQRQTHQTHQTQPTQQIHQPHRPHTAPAEYAR